MFFLSSIVKNFQKFQKEVSFEKISHEWTHGANMFI